MVDLPYQTPTALPIDPTKNVLDTVSAAVQRQDDLRDAEARYQNAMREAESRRLEQRMADDRYYGERIAGMLAKSVENTSALLSKQVEQTQAGLNVRVTELEKNRYESSGKSAGVQASWGVIIGAVAAGGGIVGAIVAIVGALTRLSGAGT